MQELLNVPEDEKIPSNLIWDYGTNEKIDDNKKIATLSSIQRVMAIPYSTRAKIITPIINKLIDTDLTEEELIKGNIEERDKIKFEYEEL